MEPIKLGFLTVYPFGLLIILPVAGALALTAGYMRKAGLKKETQTPLLTITKIRPMTEVHGHLLRTKNTAHKACTGIYSESRCLMYIENCLPA